jgi:hypothetical protein
VSGGCCIMLTHCDDMAWVLLAERGSGMVWRYMTAGVVLSSCSCSCWHPHQAVAFSSMWPDGCQTDRWCNQEHPHTPTLGASH